MTPDRSQPMNAELRDVLELLNQPRTRSQYGGADDMVTDLLRERAEIAERLAAISRPVVPDGDGWMPIESAPDVGDVLTFSRSKRVSIEDARYLQSMRRAAVVDEEPCFYTHWRPLPAPPAARSAEEK